MLFITDVGKIWMPRHASIFDMVSRERSSCPLEDLGNILLAAAHIKYFYVNTATGEKSGEVLSTCFWGSLITSWEWLCQKMALFRMVESISSALSIERIIQSRYQSIQEVMSTQFDIFLANYNTTYYICQYILRSTTMAQATLSMRVDETLKKSFDSICDDFGHIRITKSTHKIALRPPIQDLWPQTKV